MEERQKGQVRMKGVEAREKGSRVVPI